MITNKHVKQILVAALMVVGMFVLATTASAESLHDVLPGGLPKHNAKQAYAKLHERAEVDPALAEAIAKQGGASSINQLKPVGYSNGAPAGSINSGVSESGNLDGAQETSKCNIHSRMLVLINVETSAKVFICTNCSNPRLFHEPPPVFRPFSKGTVVKYKKTVSKKQKICGSEITITVTIHGTLRAKTWGKISGDLQMRLKAAFHAAVIIETKAKCAPASTTPCGCESAPKTTVTNPCQGFSVSGMQVSGNQCVVTVCGTSVVLNGSNYGTIIIESNNCNTPEKPCGCEKHEEPKCPAGTTGTPPNCEAPKCPAGTVGTPPNCEKPKCPEGTIGSPPNCEVPKCPEGTTGTPPNCEKPKCPAGTTGTPPNCEAPKCPAGTVGTPPNCEKPPIPCELSNLRKLEAKDKGEGATPGGTEPITVELSGCPSDSVELVFHDEFGHFEQSKLVVSKPGKYQETLVIPKDVGLEEDTYWVTATDLKTGQQMTTEHWTYGIKPLKEEEFF